MIVSVFADGMPGLIAPALMAGLLIASTHVPLGQEVLKRGIIFLDLAVAQIAGLGAIAATTFMNWQGIGAQIIAFLSALGAALLFSWLEKKGQTIQEAFIGCAFVLAASFSILLFAGDPNSGEEMNNLMAGQILWVSWNKLAFIACIYAPILFLIFCRPQFSRKHFYLIFASCITLSVQIVGVYLVFASLILPALASYGLSDKHGLKTGYIAAALAVTGGLIFSVLSDLPSAPVLVCSYAAVAVGIIGVRKACSI